MLLKNKMIQVLLIQLVVNQIIMVVVEMEVTARKIALPTVSPHLQHLREVNHIKDTPRSNHTEVQPQLLNNQQQLKDQVSLIPRMLQSQDKVRT